MSIASELTPEEFYHATLANQGLLDDALSITKEAEVKIAALAQERGLPVEIVKLAEAFYQQLDLDGFEYDDAATQREDALKIAEAYHEHLTEVRTNAVELADKAVQKLAAAAEAFIAEQGLDLTPAEVLKMAELQASTAAAYDQAAAEEHAVKVATHESLKKEAVRYDVRVENGEAKVASSADWFYSGADPHVSTARPDQVALDLLQKSRNLDPATVQGLKPQEVINRFFISSDLGHIPEKSRSALLSRLAVNMRQDPSQNHWEHLASLTAPPAATPSWASRHKGALIAGGLLGAGALYYLKKKRDEENNRRESELNQLRARLLPPA